MFNFPIFLNLENISCLVVGAGRTGLRKARKLLAAGACSICLLDCKPPIQEEAELASLPTFQRKQKWFESADIEGFQLVFAATNNQELNAEIAALCFKKQILCSVASIPESGQFITPASGEKGGILLAVSNLSKTPHLSRLICEELLGEVCWRHSRAVELMLQVRPFILKSTLNPAQRRILLNCLVEFALSPDDVYLDHLKRLDGLDELIGLNETDKQMETRENLSAEVWLKLEAWLAERLKPERGEQ